MLRALILVPLLMACKGDGSAKDAADDTDAGGLSGLYETRKMLEAADSCSGPEEVIPIPYLKLAEADGVLDVFQCRDTDDCNTTPDAEWQMEQGEKKWKGTDHSGEISESTSTCYMWYQERTLEVDGTEITLERMDYSQTDDSISRENECAEESAVWNGSGGTCSHLVRIVAKKL